MSTAPNTISSVPRERPLRAATVAARKRSPVRHQTIARSTRPPSSGAPGSRLNNASTILVAASQPSAAVTALPGSTVDAVAAAARNTTPKARLVAGPAIAIRKSLRASRGSSPNSDAPPNSHSTIRSTRTRWRRATIEWASSWAVREMNNTTAAHPATDHTNTGVPVPRSWTPRIQTNKATVTSTDQCAPIRIPAIRPRVTVSCNIGCLACGAVAAVVGAPTRECALALRPGGEECFPALQDQWHPTRRTRDIVRDFRAHRGPTAVDVVALAPAGRHCSGPVWHQGRRMGARAGRR